MPAVVQYTRSGSNPVCYLFHGRKHPTSCSCSLPLGGRLESGLLNTDDNYVAEACGLLCSLWTTPVNTSYVGYVDSRALLHRLAHPLSQLNRGRSCRFPEGLRLRMAARPIIMAIMAVLHARAAHGSVTRLLHQRSHTGAQTFSACLLSEADALANSLRHHRDEGYPARYTDFEEQLYLVECAGGDPEFCDTHVLGNTRQHVRRAQRYRTLRKMAEPGSAHNTSRDQRVFLRSTQPPVGSRDAPAHNPLGYFKWLRLPSTCPDERGDQPPGHSCLLCGEGCLASEDPWTCPAQSDSAVKHRILRYSSLSLSIFTMALEIRLSAPATVLFVTIVIALVVPPSHPPIFLPYLATHT
eukprot:g36518.t1